MGKKILIANSYIPWGGLGQYSITLAKGFMKQGHDVYGLVTHNDDQLFKDFSSNTVNTCFLGNSPKLLKYYQCIKFINKLKPDVIIVNYLATLHFILPFIHKCKVISVIHSDQSDFYRISSINRKFVDHWIAPSKRVHDGFIKYLGTSKFNDRISIIPHGVSVSSIQTRRINLSTFNIVFVGALYNHKGVDLLPEIFSRFKSKCPNSTLTIIGDGELKSILVEKFESLGIAQDVYFTGVITNNEVREYLYKMDVLCFPTRIESFGLVIAEAMMDGTVPVVTLLKEITDTIVIDETNGFLIEMENIGGYVNRLKVLYFDRELLLRMSNSASKYAYEKFTEYIMIRNYIHVIE